jgi:predicted ATPase
LLEDAHWSDQTTQTLIERMLKRIGREHALVLITHRPELKTNWSEHPQATLITCKQIGHEHCAALIRNVASRSANGRHTDPGDRDAQRRGAAIC